MFAEPIGAMQTGSLQCLRCLWTRKLCPRQVDFWVTRITEELSKPLESIASMFELYGRRRMQPRPRNLLSDSESDSESDTSDNTSEASYRPKSGLKPEKTVTCRSSRARGGLGKHEESQEVMAKVTKTLANITEIKKRVKAMTIEIAVQKKAHVEAEAELSAVLADVEKGQWANARELAGRDGGSKDKNMKGEGLHLLGTGADI